MAISLKQLMDYNNISINWINKNPNNRDTKFGYAIEKLRKEITKYLKLIAELHENKHIEINDINSDNALTDPTTKKFIYDIIKDKDGADVQHYCYTPETRKKRDNEIRQALKKYDHQLEVLLETQIECPCYYASEIPSNLTETEIEIFTGIIIDPNVGS